MYENEWQDNFIIKKTEKDLSSKELIMEKYGEIINWREKRYDRDVKDSPSKKDTRMILNVHNGIVLDYAVEIIEKEKLDAQEKVEAILATIMHDSGKLSSGCLEHHKKGVEYVEDMIEEMTEKKIDGIEINETVGQKIKAAVERHMNHPYLVMTNKGERFPEPGNRVDKVVFDADMLANIGFKNVAFRISDEEMFKKDSLRAENKNVIEESFRNVLEGEIFKDGKKNSGACGLDEVVLLDSSRKIAVRLIDEVRRIFDDLKKNNSLAEIQKKFSDEEGHFNLDTISDRGGVELMKKLLNDEIEKSAVRLGIENEIAARFKM